ncbi:MAG TPA: antitoxin Xre/MbcA/ParS toxin-binding domain-containing protein [Candidatus Acidoferrales bacterium]|nr:antitoxin Xre/MbcA/ParS toxin-binding domain-containing protein [Candidatus Acidoferrales bacterium]
MTSGFYQSTHGHAGRRLNAHDITNITGLTVSELAGFIGVKSAALKKDPAAPEAQPGLAKFVRAWEQLQTLFPGDDAIKAWLDHPVPALAGRTPKWLLDEHGVDAFTEMIAEMLEGGHG